MVYANDFVCGNDSETIQQAIENRKADGIRYGRPVCAKNVSVSNYVHGCYGKEQ